MKKINLILFLLLFSLALFAQETVYEIETDISYYSDSINKSDDYISNRCVLDIYYPKNKKGFSTLVWFHGGGLMYGKKKYLKRLRTKGFALLLLIID